MFEKVIFKEYDIRGVYNSQFDLEFAEQLGKAFVSYLDKLGKKDPKISVGYDARLSSPEICEALTKGLTSSGANVHTLGLITTPISYYSSHAIEGLDGAVMITGSHNPPEYNGFKITVDQAAIFGEEIQKLRRIVEDQDFVSGQGSSESFDIKSHYIKRYAEEFKGLKQIPVVFDCGNGAAGSVLKDLLSAIGYEATILFEEPDGRFPNHHPDPTVEKYLKDLSNKVRDVAAYVGIGFDGDADRIGIVDEQGKMVLGDELMTIFGRGILKDLPGSLIIGDVKCSDRMYQDIEKLGGKPLMWKTGHSLIKQKIKEEKAPFGGEMSGHVCFTDRNLGYDDAIYAALRLIELLGKENKPVSKILEDYPAAFTTPEIRIDTTEEKKHKIVDVLKEKYGEESPLYTVNLIDGIRISFKDGWALARASNTQPVLVLRFESESQEGLKRIRDEIEQVVNQYL